MRRCGAHIDGRIPSNPAQYVRRPRVHPTAQRGMDRGELASFLYTAERTSPMHAALAVLLGLNGLRVSEACGAFSCSTATPVAGSRHDRDAWPVTAEKSRNRWREPGIHLS